MHLAYSNTPPPAPHHHSSLPCFYISMSTTTTSSSSNTPLPILLNSFLLPSLNMSKPGRQLGQLLQEQQEPFVLEAYLLERGCLQKTSFTSEGGFSCCYGSYSSNKHLKRSSPRCDLNIIGGKGVPQCSQILRAVFDKLVSITGNPKGDDEVGSMDVCKEVAEEDRFSPAGGTAVFKSCAGGDTEDDSASLEVHLDRSCSTAATTGVQALKQTELTEEEVQRRSKKHGFRFRFRLRLRPVSVSGGSADGTRKQQNSSTRKSGFSSRVTDDSVSAPSLLNILIQSLPAEGALIWPKTSLQCIKSKGALPVDRIREAAAHEGNGRGRSQKGSIREFLASEELEKLECQKIRAWGKQSRKETSASVNHMAKLDFTASAREWNGCESESRKLGREVEEVILEETINEMIIDMIRVLIN